MQCGDQSEQEQQRVGAVATAERERAADEAGRHRDDAEEVGADAPPEHRESADEEGGRDVRECQQRDHIEYPALASPPTPKLPTACQRGERNRGDDEHRGRLADRRVAKLCAAIRTHELVDSIAVLGAVGVEGGRAALHRIRAFEPDQPEDRRRDVHDLEESGPTGRAGFQQSGLDPRGAHRGDGQGTRPRGMVRADRDDRVTIEVYLFQQLSDESIGTSQRSIVDACPLFR